MTLLVVKFVFPLGKPGGMLNPAGEKNGWVWLTPSSMIPIFIPLPAVARFGPHSAVAPISCGVWFSVALSGRARGSGRTARPWRLPAAWRAGRARTWEVRPRARPGRCCSASGRSRTGSVSRSGSGASAARPRGRGDSSARRCAQVEPLVARRHRERRGSETSPARASGAAERHDDLGARCARQRQAQRARAPPVRREEQDPVSGGEMVPALHLNPARMWRNW